MFESFYYISSAQDTALTQDPAGREEGLMGDSQAKFFLFIFKFSLRFIIWKTKIVCTQTQLMYHLE